MANDTKTAKSALRTELDTLTAAILKSIPAMLSGTLKPILTGVFSFMGKLVASNDALEARVKELEAARAGA